MKKIKISIIAIVAIVMGIAGSAFTIESAPKPFTDSWFVYNDVGDIDDPGSYVYSGTTPSCQQTMRLCAIKVLNNGSNQPDPDAFNDLYNDTHFASPVNGLIKFKN